MGFSAAECRTGLQAHLVRRNAEEQHGEGEWSDVTERAKKRKDQVSPFTL